ncbi:MAG: InlB B-repeat-containing protein [Clostridia bacterium]|nr:InlB B-repeat-containing protein [Clostridia bacterium]
MKGKLLKKLVSIAIALTILTSLASVSFAEGRKDKSGATSIVVSFNMGRYIKRVEVEPGESVKKPDHVPEKEGYAFSHWYLKNDQLQTPYDFNLPVTKQLKLEPLYLFVAPVIGEKAEDGQDNEKPEDQDTDAIQEDPITDAPTDQADPADTNSESKESVQNDSTSNDADSDGSHTEDNVKNDESATDDNTQDDENEDESETDDNERDDENNNLTEDQEIEYDMETEQEDEEQGNTSTDENDLLPKHSIRIWTDAPEQVEEGYLITLRSELLGYEDCIVALCWQYSTDGGASWLNAVGGSAYTYTYAACEELSNCFWRLCVTVLEDMSK